MRNTVMRASYFATTALVAVSLFGGGATAQSAFDSAISATQDSASPVVQRQPAFAVRIAGTLRVDATWVDQDETVITQKGVTPVFIGPPVGFGPQWDFGPFPMSPGFHLFDTRRDVAIIGSTTADNGLSYGFNYDVDEDRAALYLANRYGRIDMGNTATATDALDVSGSSVMVGRGAWLTGGSKNVNHMVGGMNQVSLNRPAGFPGFSGGGTIRYTTPNYGGLAISVSYTEESDGTVNQDNVAGQMVDGNAMSIEDIWSIAGQYTSSYGNYTTVVYAGYEQGNRGLKGGVVPGAFLFPGNCCGFSAIDLYLQDGHHDISILSLGAKVTGMGAGFGVGYGKISVDTLGSVPAPLNPAVLVLFPDQDAEWFDIGLSYSSGPWAISAGATHIVKDDGGVLGANGLIALGPFDNTTADQKQTAFSVSANYRLAPGLSISGGITHWEIENSDAFNSIFSPWITDVDWAAVGLPGAPPGPNTDNSATTITIATQMNF
jgi:predicted porin